MLDLNLKALLIKSKIPTFFNPAAKATKVANQINTLNAALSESKSSHEIIPDRIIIETILIAVIVESTPSSFPNIQRTKATVASPAIKYSLNVTEPNFFNSSAAQVGASGDFFCVGGYKT